MKTFFFKSAFALLHLTLTFSTLLAQSPELMSYQAVIRNPSGQLVVNTQIGMQVSILQDSVGGSVIYKEIYNPKPQTNANGLVSIEIGAGIPLTGSFGSIDWSAAQYYIKTETDPGGGTHYTISVTSQLLSVPYAFHAKTAESLVGGGGSAHYIGEQFGGGVIFHLWKDSAGVERGLIVSLHDLSTYQVWSNIGDSLIGVSAQSIWDGLSNSNAIVAQTDHYTSAAFICLISTNGGQTDWYLPSIDELRLLWHNRFIVNKTISSIVGASILPIMGFPTHYWSSSEVDAISVWSQNFYNGSQNTSFKYSWFNVRAIRAF